MKNYQGRKGRGRGGFDTSIAGTRYKSFATLIDEKIEELFTI
jgi:hypothetical protein